MNEKNTSISYEEPCDNLFILNTLFFICKSSYNVKDIDVTKHVVAMIITASKRSKNYVLINFIFNVRILHFCDKKALKDNTQNNEISKSYYSSEESEEYITHLLRFQYRSKSQSFQIAKQDILSSSSDSRCFSY